jgi:lysophospholipase L1-like esterase
MYELAKTRGRIVPVVAGSIPPYNTASADANARMRQVNEWIHAYAERHPQVAYCDTRGAVARPGDPDRLLSSPDDLHPSPEGYRLMALALEPLIKKLLMRTAREPDGRQDA